MIVTYRPDGEEVQAFEFDPERVRVKRAEAIEKAAGMTWDEWNNAVLMGSASARRVLLWHLLSLTHPKLRLGDVDFAMHEVVVEMTLSEMIAMRDDVTGSNRIPAEQREQALQILEADIEEARAKADAEEAAAAAQLPQEISLSGDAGADMQAAFTAVAGGPPPRPHPSELRPTPYDGGDLAVDGLGKAR